MPVGVDAETDLACEIARLKVAIGCAAAATERMLTAHRSASAEHEELNRQLGALHECLTVAEHRNEGPGALRAELATLLSFARALQSDAENWRSELLDQVKELERQRTGADDERERLAAERRQLVRRRDALQSTILQTAARLAQEYRGECRRTVPVFTLDDGLTVCSVAVSCPRRGFRFPRQWLVTLTGSRDVLIRRE